jgi:hypothetical protein
MQDAIYNQIQVATNLANKPYQSYAGPTVAELSSNQQKAYDMVGQNAGAWQGALNAVQSGMSDFAKAGTADQLRTDQGKYLRQDLVNTNLDKGQSYWDQAGKMDIVGAAQPALSRAMGIDSVAAAQPYLSQAGQAAGNIYGSAQPYMNQAGATTAQALSDRALNAANPYLQASAQSAGSQVGQYMNPYQQNVMDVMAQQSARNLQENLLPAISDQFVRAGQFGSRRMGEFGSRALRDTQQALLAQQAQNLQQGYGQALGAAQTDLARQAQLAGTVGSISGADLSRVLQGGAQYGNLAQTQGQLTGQQAQALANVGQTAGQLSAQQMQNLTNLGQTQGQLTGQQMSQLANLGQMQTGAGQAQQQFGLSAAQAAQGAQAQDYARQMSALQNMAQLAGQKQSMGYTDTAALEAAGRSQQQQVQSQLDAAKAQYEQERLYPMQQADWLNAQVRGMAPFSPQLQSQTGTTTGATYSPSPLSQLATGLYTYKGLKNMGEG